MNANLEIELLKLVMGLMPIAEEIFSDRPKSGADKKAFVIETTKAVADTIVDVSTGGQKETWGIIGRVINPFIDLAHGLLKAFGLVNK